MHKISSKNIKVSIEKTWKNYQKYAKKYTKSSPSRQRHTLKKYSVVTITVIPRIFVVNFTRKDHAIFKTFRNGLNGLKIPQNDPQQRRRNLLWFFFVESPSTRIITIISAIFDEKRVISSQEIAIYKKAIIHKIRQPPLPPPPPHKKKCSPPSFQRSDECDSFLYCLWQKQCNVQKLSQIFEEIIQSIKNWQNL